MVNLEVCRVLLFIIEWIWTAVVTFIFPDKLIGSDRDIKAKGNVCFFDRQIDLSRCRFGFAWGFIALLILTAVIIWWSLLYCSRTIDLPLNVEHIIFVWLTLWWFLGAIVLSATKAKGAGNAARAAVVFAWMLTIFCGVSAFLANHEEKRRGEDQLMNESEGQDSLYDERI